MWLKLIVAITTRLQEQSMLSQILQFQILRNTSTTLHMISTELAHSHSHSCCMHYTTRSPRFIRWPLWFTAHMTKFLLIKFSHSSYKFVRLGFNHFPRQWLHSARCSKMEHKINIFNEKFWFSAYNSFQIIQPNKIFNKLFLFNSQLCASKNSYATAPQRRVLKDDIRYFCSTTDRVSHPLPHVQYCFAYLILYASETGRQNLT